MRALAFSLSLLVLGTAARSASAVCTASDVMGSAGTSCSASMCAVSKQLTVTPPTAGAPCTFDFGTRDVVFATSGTNGGLTSGSNPFEIRAHSLTIGTNGTLKATGQSLTPGGIITLTLGAGGFTVLKSANPIDVTGARGTTPAQQGGGSLIVNSDGNVSIAGTIMADGTSTSASGGVIMVTAGRLSGTTVVASGNLTITSTGTLSSGGKLQGFGGTISLTANGVSGSGTIDIENKISAVGGSSGGAINLQAKGDINLGTTPSGSPLLVADANGDAGCGGCVDLLAGGNISSKNGVSSAISAQGSNALLSTNGGGIGGMIAIEAQKGVVNLGGGPGGEVIADGGVNGCGGSVCINTDTPGAAMTLGVPLSAQAGGASGFGGCILAASSGPAVLHSDISASAGGCGGTAEVDALQAMTVEAPSTGMHADALAGSGGCVTLSGSGLITLSGPLLSAKTQASLTNNFGGEVDVFGDPSIVDNGPIDVSALGPNVGGIIDMEAGANFTIGPTATLNADGGRTGGQGGTLTLIAGWPDLPGTLTLNGSAHALGTSTAGVPANALAMGCAVHVGATGILDTTGDPQASNMVVARTSLVTDAGAAIKTTGVDPKSRNFVTLPVGAPLPGGSAFTPALAPSDVKFEPVCTALHTPPNCLTPCPVCGNGVVEFPETCDNGAANGPCQPCGPTCRTVNCNDNNPCTTDTCDAIAGCMNTFIPGCTTTTTTLTTTTSTSTTSPTVTSSTLASTTTTTVTATRTTVSVATSTTVAAIPSPTTSTTTTLPCTSARCIVQAAETTGACAGQTIPASVTAKFTQAETLIDQAATSPAKKAAKLFKKARKALSQAGAKAIRAAKGKKPQLSTGCAAAIKDAAVRIAALL